LAVETAFLNGLQIATSAVWLTESPLSYHQIQCFMTFDIALSWIPIKNIQVGHSGSLKDIEIISLDIHNIHW